MTQPLTIPPLVAALNEHFGRNGMVASDGARCVRIRDGWTEYTMKPDEARRYLRWLDSGNPSSVNNFRQGAR